uniref:SF3 helicase domain-containing protein n=1 Tax=Giant panda Picornavirales TaxID=2903094 RepID=A0A8K1ZLQ1_9VIRU|nr:MAG: hypothetical protein 1 [Giant panda Picornavirales]
MLHNYNKNKPYSSSVGVKQSSSVGTASIVSQNVSSEEEDLHLVSRSDMRLHKHITDYADIDSSLMEAFWLRFIKECPHYTEEELYNNLLIGEAEIKCACSTCILRNDPTIWKSYYKPRKVNFRYEFLMSEDYIMRIVRSITLENKKYQSNMFGIIVNHNLLNVDFVKSMRRFVRGDRVEGIAMMDIPRRVTERVVRAFTGPVLDNLEEKTEPIMKEMREMVSDISKSINNASNSTHSVQGLDNLSEAINRLSSEGINVNSQSVDGLVKEGLKINMGSAGGGIEGLLQGVTGMILNACSPIKILYDFITSKFKDDPRLKDFAILISVVFLECIRLKLEKKNKYYTMLIPVEMALSYMATNDIIRNFATGYFGGVALIKILKLIQSWSDGYDSEDEEVKASDDFEACSDMCPKGLMTRFFDVLVSLVTGITDSLTIRNVAIALSTYKMLVNGLDFTLNSIFNLVQDLFNLLGRPFGIELFRKTYSKYPELYEATEYFNKIKNCLESNGVPIRSEIEVFKRHIEVLQKLELKIPHTSDYTNYRNILAHLLKVSNGLSSSLRSLGVLNTVRRKATYVTTLIGAPGTFKTNYAHALFDLAHEVEDLEKDYLEYKSNRIAYVTSWKANVEFQDSVMSTHTCLLVDDFMQSKKPATPDKCAALQLIDLCNNDDVFINCSDVRDKQTRRLNNRNTIITSNHPFLRTDEIWASDSEAIIRRLQGVHNCVYEVRAKPEYQIPHGETFGYKVNAALKAKTKFDPKAFTIVRKDFRDYTDILDDNGMGLPHLSHEDFVLLYMQNKVKHDTKENLLALSMSCIAEDPEFNPFLNGGVHSESRFGRKHRLGYQAMMDADVRIKPCAAWLKKYDLIKELFIDEEGYFRKQEHILASSATLRPHQIPMFLEAMSAMNLLPPKSVPDKTIHDFEELDDYLEYLYDKHKDRINRFYQMEKGSFITESSLWIWGLLGNEKWSKHAMSHHRYYQDCIESLLPKFVFDFISSDKLAHINGILNPMAAYDTFVVTFHVCVEVAGKVQELAELFGWSFAEFYQNLTNSGMTWDEFAHKSVTNIAKIFRQVLITSTNVYYLALSAACQWSNVWASTVVGLVGGLLVAAKSVQTVVAASDYDKNNKIHRNPLAKKCKNSSIVKSKCPCTDCVILRTPKGSLPVVQGVSTSDTIKLNDIQNQDGMLKRCVFNILLYDGTGEVPIESTANNITMVCSEIGFTNHHFYLEMMSQYERNPNIVCRFTAYNGKTFDVNPMEMEFDLKFKDLDLVVWINKKGKTSFGGGLRNYSDKYINQGDNEITYARMVHAKYDRVNSKLDFNVVAIDVVSKGRVTYWNSLSTKDKNYFVECYFLRYPCVPGMCGAVAMDAKTGKFFGVINAGGGDGKFTCITPITHEMIQDMISKYSLHPISTELLPDVVLERNNSLMNKIPSGHIISACMDDPHHMNDFNKYEKTPFHGCIGPLDMIPTFVAPWKNGVTGVVNDPLMQTRKKYDVKAPAINSLLLDMAGSMFVSTVEKVAPKGLRAFVTTVDEALNGVYGESPISVKTSPGGKYILEGITKKSIVKRTADQTLDFSSPDGIRFLKDIQDKQDQAFSRTMHKSYTNEFGKAEVLDKTKVLEGLKLRLVCGVDADKVISDKMVFTCVSKFFREVGLGAGVCFSMDPSSYDAHTLAVMLRIYNENIPYDIGGWDTTFYSYKYHAVLRVIKMLMTDITPEHFSAMEVSAESNMYAIHMAHIRYIDAVLDGSTIVDEEKFVNTIIFYEWWFGMQSGSYITLLFNTLAHAIDLRYMVLVVYCKKILNINFLNYCPSIHGIIPFENLERLMVTILLGDDGNISRSPSMDFLNFSSLKWAFSQHYMKCTNAAKDGNDSALCSIHKDIERSELTFCKHGWVWNQRYNRWVMALDFNSLKKMLYYSENSLSEYKQVIDDYFKGLSKYGREIFEINAPPVSQISKKSFRYTSPYAHYDIAIASAIGGLKDTIARRLGPVFQDRDYTPTSEEEIDDCIRLLKSLEIHREGLSCKTLGLDLVLKDLRSVVEKKKELSTKPVRDMAVQEMDVIALSDFPDGQFVPKMFGPTRNRSGRFRTRNSIGRFC